MRKRSRSETRHFRNMCQEGTAHIDCAQSLMRPIPLDTPCIQWILQKQHIDQGRMLRKTGLRRTQQNTLPCTLCILFVLSHSEIVHDRSPRTMAAREGFGTCPLDTLCILSTSGLKNNLQNMKCSGLCPCFQRRTLVDNSRKDLSHCLACMFPDGMGNSSLRASAQSSNP